MPNLDKTGPQGNGPTGRGRGGCENASQSSGFFGRGIGRRFCGRGMGRGFAGLCAVEQGDQAVLEAQIKAHQAKINFLQKRLDELEEQDN